MMTDLIENLEGFTYPAYIQLIKHLKNNYELIPAREYNCKTNEPTVVVRHDVDWDFESALHMARLEHDINVKSTYFVLLSCPSYNLFSEHGIKGVRELLELGHEIGLHYDISVYNHYPELAYDELLEFEINSLELITQDQRISSIVCHNPTISGQDPLRNVWIRNLSTISLFDHYVHEANRQWKHEYLKPLINKVHIRNMINTHPCLWSDELVEDRYDWIHQCMHRIEDSWVKLWRGKDEKTK